MKKLELKNKSRWVSSETEEDKNILIRAIMQSEISQLIDANCDMLEQIDIFKLFIIYENILDNFNIYKEVIMENYEVFV
jgi:hypothetical protein